MTIHNRALVLGATGLVGQQLVAQLLADERYEQVTCLLRKPLSKSVSETDKRGVLQPVVVDFESFDDYLGYFSVDHVYVCLGTTIKQAKSREAFRKVDFELVYAAAQMAGQQNCKSFVWVSSVGADARSNNFYLRVKGELENAIMALKSLKQAHAVRPSLLLGQRNEFRFAEHLGVLLAPVLSPLLMGSLKKYRPVEASEVARQMIALQDFEQGSEC